jgi:hypothetical protein
MQKIITYALTLSMGVAMAFGVAKLVGIWFPSAFVPVCVVLTLCWVYMGWKHAVFMDHQRNG